MKPPEKPPKKSKGRPSQLSSSSSKLIKQKTASSVIMRLNQFLAHATGVSRREADKLISEGLVRVNGKPGQLGQEVHSVTDKITCRGKVCELARRRYILFNKPKGLITTRKDDKDRKTIYDVLPPDFQNLKPAGRLDRQTSGLLILSDDGEFLNHLTHPKHNLVKHYRARLDKSVTKTLLKSLQQGVVLLPENKVASVMILDQVDEVTLVLSTKTGYYRQIRRMFSELGFDVKDLKRLAIGPITLGSLRPGAYRELTLRERNQITQISNPKRPS